MRKEILDYAKKMGYFSEEMTPVEMWSGTKSLIFNADGTYSIFFGWKDCILKKVNRELLEEFTKYFFRKEVVEVKSSGILMMNLPEDKVFSIWNIDMFRKYDIQLFFLSKEFDKRLLLRAVMQITYVSLPYITLRMDRFEELGNIKIPEDKQERIVFSEFGTRNLNCGKVYHDSEKGTYIYKITVPYTEYIRELMVDAEKILKEKYGKMIYVSFSGFQQNMFISCKGEDIGSVVERELICLDYAMMLLEKRDQINEFQLYKEVFSLLEADSSGQYRKEYLSCSRTFEYVLHDKC